jgi:glutamyl-tRNA synthetase
MLAVVVDDHDMGVTQVIRGDDHFTNTFRQLMIYDAMGWEAPAFAHIPLIHGPDGAKLSKRHGALGVQEYEKMGYLPEATCNYLLRLGWSHGDEEIISREKAIEWFDLDAVGKSPSRFDFAKLENLNGLYIREADDAVLTKRTIALIEASGKSVSAIGKERLLKGMNGLKQRAKTLVQLAEGASVYLKDTKEVTAAAPQMLKEFFAAKPAGEQAFKKLLEAIKSAPQWDRHALETIAKDTAAASGVKLGDIAQPLRIAASASTVTPPIFEVMEILGKDETVRRLEPLKNFS